MTPVTPMGSMPERGKISANAGRIGTAVCYRGCVCGVSRGAPLADWIPLSCLRWSVSMADAAGTVVMSFMPAPNQRYSRDDLSGQPTWINGLVSGDLVDMQPEGGGQCPWPPTSARMGQLSDGMGVSAQTAPGDGASGSRPSWRARGGGRDLFRRTASWATRPWRLGQGFDRCGGSSEGAGSGPDSNVQNSGCIGQESDHVCPAGGGAEERGSNGRIGWVWGADRSWIPACGGHAEGRHPGKPTATARAPRCFAAQTLDDGHTPRGHIRGACGLLPG